MPTQSPPIPIPRVQVSSQIPYELASRLESWRLAQGHKSTSSALKALLEKVLP